MIIEVPKNYYYFKEGDDNKKSDYAYEENSNLIIIGNINFDDLMHFT